MILSYRGRWPKIHETAFVAPSADIIGDVEIGSHSSIWFQTVIRGDVHQIRIGENTNIQDHCMLHVTRVQSPLWIGNEVTVGHRVMLHGCTVRDRVLLGMGAILLDGAEIGEESLVGAGTLITKHTKIPPGSLVLGTPGRVVRPLTALEKQDILQSAKNYVQDGIEYHSYVAGPVRIGAGAVDLDVFSASHYPAAYTEAYEED